MLSGKSCGILYIIYVSYERQHTINNTGWRAAVTEQDLVRNGETHKNLPVFSSDLHLRSATIMVSISQECLDEIKCSAVCSTDDTCNGEMSFGKASKCFQASNFRNFTQKLACRNNLSYKRSVIFIYFFF